MFSISDHLALARRRLIKMRTSGLSFDPAHGPEIKCFEPLKELEGGDFDKHVKKAKTSRVVLVETLPLIDDPRRLDAVLLGTLWGEVVVLDMGAALEASEEERKLSEGFQLLVRHLTAKDTAYITVCEEATVKLLRLVDIELDEAVLTGLGRWHAISDQFAPTVVSIFREWHTRLTAPFRGEITYGWNDGKSGDKGQLAPEQARLAFALGNSMAFMALDGVVPSLDQEEPGDLSRLGKLVIEAEHTELLEAPELMVMENLRLDQEDASEEEGAQLDREAKLKVEPMKKCVSWGHLEQAVQEPLGRIYRCPWVYEVPEEHEQLLLRSRQEEIKDWSHWEESLSFLTLLGGEHVHPEHEVIQRPPDSDKESILKTFDEGKIRRANERLGRDPDDMDHGRKRFSRLDLRDKEICNNQTASPPPRKRDVLGLWEEEARRQAGGRQQGPPFLRWEVPILRKKQKGAKRDRDLEERLPGSKRETRDRSTNSPEWESRGGEWEHGGRKNSLGRSGLKRGKGRYGSGRRGAYGKPKFTSERKDRRHKHGRSSSGANEEGHQHRGRPGYSGVRSAEERPGWTGRRGRSSEGRNRVGSSSARGTRR